MSRYNPMYHVDLPAEYEFDINDMVRIDSVVRLSGKSGFWTGFEGLEARVVDRHEYWGAGYEENNYTVELKKNGQRVKVLEKDLSLLE